eukprot:11575776-Alexandrium_andersonii.AAC.1
MTIDWKFVMKTMQRFTVAKIILFACTKICCKFTVAKSKMGNETKSRTSHRDHNVLELCLAVPAM